MEGGGGGAQVPSLPVNGGSFPPAATALSGSQTERYALVTGRQKFRRALRKIKEKVRSARVVADGRGSACPLSAEAPAAPQGAGQVLRLEHGHVQVPSAGVSAALAAGAWRPRPGRPCLQRALVSPWGRGRIGAAGKRVWRAPDTLLRAGAQFWQDRAPVIAYVVNFLLLDLCIALAGAPEGGERRPPYNPITMMGATADGPQSLRALWGRSLPDCAPHTLSSALPSAVRGHQTGGVRSAVAVRHAPVAGQGGSPPGALVRRPCRALYVALRHRGRYRSSPRTAR